MDLADSLALYSLKTAFYGLVILIIFIFLSLAIKPLSSFLKKLFFISIVFTVVFVTLFLAGTTIYLNIVSASKGPVHYHADFEIWNCGREITLKDPKGLSNKIGSPILHEHNDKRIHLEGVVVEEKDQSLGRFFGIIGGELSSNFFSVPSNEGQVNLISGAACPDGQIAALQVFVYKTIYNNYYQQKITDPENYIFSSYTNAPPGNCIIIEFDSLKNRTEKLCQSYKVAKQTGKLKGEIKYGN